MFNKDDKEEPIGSPAPNETEIITKGE